MILEPYSVNRPAQAEIDDLTDDGNMRPEVLAQFGEAAVMAGAQDWACNGLDDNGLLTDAGDAIANIMHWLDSKMKVRDPEAALEKARMHFNAERGNG